MLILILCVLFVNLVLFGKVYITMATVQDLQDNLQGISDDVAGLATEIASLKAAAGPVSQTQLDDLTAKAQAIRAAIAAAR